MNRDELSIGDEVIFGRDNGEKTLGLIAKLNPKSAVIEVLEDGNGNRRKTGAKWRVAYVFIHSVVKPAGSQRKTPVVEQEIAYNPFSTVENHLMGALVAIYGSLSPENLHCDGEASLSYVVKRKEELTRQLKYTCLALGKTVTEEQAYKWDDLRRESAKVQSSA